MTFTFYPHLPAEIDYAETISGKTPPHFRCIEYLVMQDENEKHAFKIIYQAHCSLFKEAAVVGDLLLVGHEEHFYVYSLQAQHNILTLEMQGYFGHLYTAKENFYVTDAGGLYNINKAGEVIWHTTGLGIDGVIIEKFTETQIHGSGELDPPGGWTDFSVDKQTGKATTTNFG